MPAALSLTVEQHWSDMTHADRVAWFNFHGDAIARERGAFVAALEKYAKAIKNSGAYEAASFSAERFLNDTLDETDAVLAEEVRDWLGA